MSHAATTRQSSKPRNDLVLAGPIMPQPITPILMRSFGPTGGAPVKAARANGDAPNAVAAPAACIKRRRVNKGSGPEECIDLSACDGAFQSAHVLRYWRRPEVNSGEV